uniref:Uncharacterized protein n=1 Tax=Physcomitrium patens TaxID=3218 RepID=A0A7I3Z2M6_PHYPA
MLIVCYTLARFSALSFLHLAFQQFFVNAEVTLLFPFSEKSIGRSHALGFFRFPSYSRDLYLFAFLFLTYPSATR